MRRRIPVLFLLVMLAGVLMGIVANSYAQTDDPTTTAKVAQVEVENQVIETDAGDRVVRVMVGSGGGFLGIHPDEITQETVQRLGLREERGALVKEVVPDSAAAKAGIQKDDVIVRWNGTAVESAIQLRRLIQETPGGRSVRLGVIRNGREVEIPVTLDKPADHSKEFKWKMDQESMDVAREAFDHAREALKDIELDKIMVFSHRGRMGVTLQNLSPQLAEYFGLKDRSGALISSVLDDSPASRAGLRAGDIILSIDGDRIDTPGDAMRTVGRKDEGPVDIRILRDRQEMNVTVTLEKRERSGHMVAPKLETMFIPGPELEEFRMAPRIRRMIPPMRGIPLPPPGVVSAGII